MKVLIALDGSPCSRNALQSALSRAWPEDTEFLLLSVVEPATPDYASWHAAYVPFLAEAQEEIVNQARRLLDACSQEVAARLPGIKVSSEVVEGNIRDSILKRCQDWDADLVVMGSHGRRGLNKFLLGSVAEAVAGRAPCSVEIVKDRRSPGD